MALVIKVLNTNRILDKSLKNIILAFNLRRFTQSGIYLFLEFTHYDSSISESTVLYGIKLSFYPLIL